MKDLALEDMARMAEVSPATASRPINNLVGLRSKAGDRVLMVIEETRFQTHGCAVRIDPFTDEVTVWSSTQAPFHVRKQVAGILGVLESHVRCAATPLGGAFGGKFVLYEPLVVLAARTAGRCA